LTDDQEQPSGSGPGSQSHCRQVLGHAQRSSRRRICGAGVAKAEFPGQRFQELNRISLSEKGLPRGGAHGANVRSPLSLPVIAATRGVAIPRVRPLLSFSPKTTGSIIVGASQRGHAAARMTTSTTNHTSIQGPEANRLGVLGTSIIIRLVAYYVALAFVGILLWRFLPASIKDLLHSATQPLVGLSSQPVTTFMTPDPQIDVLPPSAVVLMGIIASGAAIILCLPVSWTYMFTRQKKGYSQTIVHTLLLLPVVVAIVATVVRSNAALAFSLAGIVAAVRFRVALEDSRDAVFVFAVMALGLASGVQLEAAAVLSVLFVTVVLILWYSDFARTPPSLEGERAAKHFERAVAIANRTSQFVARLDREILDSMAPAQLDALQARLDKQKAKYGLTTEEKAGEDEGPRFEGRITVHVGDPDQAQPAVEAVLQANLKRWKMVRIERTDGEARIVYAVRPKKGHDLESISNTLTNEAAPFVASVEVERWA
jgi:hypothetical protein